MDARLEKLHAFAAATGTGMASPTPAHKDHAKIPNDQYEAILAQLQKELVKMQAWVKDKGLQVVIVFEGRDAAGKGGVIKRITEHLNPRAARVVALGAPSDREKKSWYFQKYVQHLPMKGEIVIFDRSWYNRAGVERVMGFCTEDEYQLFLKQCPLFENMLIDSGILLIKYWFSVSDEEQEKRFQERLSDVTTQWKLSPMDLEARSRWVDYSKAKDVCFAHTHTPKSPWFVVESDDKKRARLNCISHLLTVVPFGDLELKKIELPPRQPDTGYVRPPKEGVLSVIPMATRTNGSSSAHAVVKMALPRPCGGPLDVWVTRRAKRAQLTGHCEELLQKRSECVLHATGAAITEAIRVATDLQRRWLGGLHLHCTTSTVTLTDELQPLDDGVDGAFVQRFSSAITIHVRVAPKTKAH